MSKDGSSLGSHRSFEKKMKAGHASVHSQYKCSTIPVQYTV